MKFSNSTKLFSIWLATLLVAMSGCDGSYDSDRSEAPTATTESEPEVSLADLATTDETIMDELESSMSPTRSSPAISEKTTAFYRGRIKGTKKDERVGSTSAIASWSDTKLVQVSRSIRTDRSRPKFINLELNKKDFVLASDAEIEALSQAEGWGLSPADLKSIFFAKSVRKSSAIVRLPRKAGSKISWQLNSQVDFVHPVAVGVVPGVEGLADLLASKGKMISYQTKAKSRSLSSFLDIEVTIKLLKPFQRLKNGSHVVFEQKVKLGSSTFGHEITGYGLENGIPKIVDSNVPAERLEICRLVEATGSTEFPCAEDKK